MGNDSKLELLNIYKILMFMGDDSKLKVSWGLGSMIKEKMSVYYKAGDFRHRLLMFKNITWVIL